MPAPKWTLEKALKEAKKYKNKTAFINKSYGAYSWIRKNKLLHLIDFLSIEKTWSDLSEKEVISELKKHKTRTSFRVSSCMYLTWIERNKRQDLLDKYIPLFKWSDKELIKRLKECKSRQEFYSNASTNLILWIKENNKKHIVEKYFPAKRVAKYTEKDVLSIMKKCKTRTEFMNKHGGAYQWIMKNNKKLLDKHLPNIRDKWNDKTVEDLMKKHKGKMNRKEFCETFGGVSWWVIEHNKKHLLDKYFPLNTGTMWDDEKVLDVIRKCSTRKEFQSKYGGAYQYAFKNNMEHILDELLPTPTERWSEDKVLCCLGESNSRNDFCTRYKSAHAWIIRHGRQELLDIFFPTKITTGYIKKNIFKKVS